MNRLRLMLLNEFKLARTALPIHGVAIFQPVLLFLLMSLILVHPTMEMKVATTQSGSENEMIRAMKAVGSPIGLPYINPIPVDAVELENTGQIIRLEERDGHLVAVQEYGLIDSNKVKNLRNRLTAAALRLWNDSLGNLKITVEEYPWLPKDMPYSIYFGMAMLSFTAFLAAAIVGGILTAQDFEFHTILEYRLAPEAAGMVLAARLTRLALTGLLSANLLLLVIGLLTGQWPGSVLRLELALLGIAVVGGCTGMAVGLLLKRSIPAYQAALVVSLAGWMLGGAFDLPASFGGWYEMVSRLVPHAHVTELLFSSYYGKVIGSPIISSIALLVMSLLAISVATILYRQHVLRKE